MRSKAFALAAILLAAAASHAFANPAVSLSWNSCTGPTNRTVSAGDVVDLYVSVLGQSQAARAYECFILVGYTTRTVPDAWRFDPTGCEGSANLQINHLAPAAVAGTCPSFQGDLFSLQIKDFTYDPVSQFARITLEDAYPNNGAGNPAATDPTQRYFLEDVHFDMQKASAGATPVDLSTCGGVERPVCFQLSDAEWIDLNIGDNVWPIASPSVTANDPTNSTRCPGLIPTASRPSTWGAIKNQYRN
jgi:hypothetical protein